MNIEGIETDIALITKDAREFKVTDQTTFEAAKENSQVCSRMRIEVVKFAEALSAAQKIYDDKADKFYRSKPKQEPEPEPEQPKAAAPSLDLDDFDAEPPSEVDELTAELRKNDRLF